MIYPEILVEIQDGLQLYVPDPNLVKPTYENLLARDPATPFPFWAKIWPAAEQMVSFLQKEPHWIAGKKVLELGAGIGLPSFAIAPQVPELVISDHAGDAVELMEKNIRCLNLRYVKAMRLDWNHFPHAIKAETVLLSDINYDPVQFDPLLVLIRRFLQEGSTIILSTPQRITVTPFAEALQPFIKQSVLQSTVHLKQPVDIRIVVLSV